MTNYYPAITIWQPWATLIMAGCKPFEFRSWPAQKRLWHQRIAIHAGARPVSKTEVRELLARLSGTRWRETGLKRHESIAILEPVLLAPASLPRSVVLCLATLGEPIRGTELADQLGMLHDSDRDEHSNWGWPLTNIEALTPYVPARGSQGWWRWTMPEVEN